MRRAIVHIGMPRTATSALQFFLSRRREALAEAGILYPLLVPGLAGERSGNHKVLGEALDGRRPRRERTVLFEALDRVLAATAADVVILSYEGLCQIGWPRRPWRPLSAALARRGFAMEILLTVKAQSEYLNSSYAWRMQFLRERRPFPAFVAATLAGRTPEARRLDYGRLVRPWAAAASGRLSAVPVRAAESEQPFLRRVFAGLGLEERVRPLITRRDVRLVVNRSPGPVAVEVARRLHAAGLARQLGPAAAEAMRFVQAETKARGLDAAPFRGVTPDLQRQIEARAAAANERFAAMAWGAAWRTRVAMPAPEPVNEIGGRAADPATEHAIEEIVAAVLAQFPVVKARWIRLSRP